MINVDGEIISNVQVTYAPHPPKAYAFYSDTAYHPEITKQIQGVDVLYHESTFLDDNQELAKRPITLLPNKLQKLPRIPMSAV